MAYKQTFEEARRKVKEKFCHLELISYTASNEMAEFHDIEYGKFSGKFSKVLRGEKNHPKRSALNKAIGSRKQSTKDKRARTCLERYGVYTPLLNTETQNKIKQTNILKFGVVHPSTATETILKSNQTKISKGISHNLNGLSARDVFDGYELNYSYSKFLELVNSIGVDSAIKWNKSKTDIEFIISDILEELDMRFVYDRQLPGTSYRPDFLVDNVIIESDGLKHHSDLYINDRLYHFNKQKKYRELGYRSLFFRGDEILLKTNIVKSIIKAKLNLINNRIFARQCSLVVNRIDGNWFRENHLMSNGSGIIYSLIYRDDIVASMQIIHKEDFIEISRFANKINTIVVGGLSKILNRVILDYKPKKIISFVDSRYGTGDSLISIGFIELSNYVSFRWTNFKQTFHRMKYPGNSGYECGLFKIWDCGQKSSF